MHSAIRNMAAIATSITTLISPSSALTTLATQAKPVQLHHSSMTTSTPRSTPCQDSSSDMYAVTWVRAKTKTRSKNSSSGVTTASWVPCRISG
jgi:hypothetical protein